MRIFVIIIRPPPAMRTMLATQSRGGEVVGHLAATAASEASNYYFYASTPGTPDWSWTKTDTNYPRDQAIRRAIIIFDRPAFSSASVLSNPQAGSPNQQKAYTSGSLDSGSFVVDYPFDEHFDVYAGVNYSISAAASLLVIWQTTTPASSAGCGSSFNADYAFRIKASPLLDLRKKRDGLAQA